MNSKNKNQQKKRPARKTAGKNVSIKDIAGKIVSITKKPFEKKDSRRKPFGGKGGRKRRLTDEEQKRLDAEARLEKLEKEPLGLVESEQSKNSIASAFNSFFYTDEKFVTQFEDKEILQYIRAAHPEYDPTSDDEHAMKYALLEILEDSKFMTELLARYDMSIFDFFKFIFRVEPSIFKGSFITKVQKAIKRKKYAAVKRHCYKFANKQAKSNRRKK